MQQNDTQQEDNVITELHWLGDCTVLDRILQTEAQLRRECRATQQNKKGTAPRPLSQIPNWQFYHSLRGGFRK